MKKYNLILISVIVGLLSITFVSPMKQVFFMGTFDNPLNNTNEFNSLMGGQQLGKTWGGTSSDRLVITAGGTISNFRFWSQNASGIAGSAKWYTMEFIEGGSTQTNVEVYINETDKDETNTTATWHFDAGDRATLRSVPTNTPNGLGRTRWSTTWEGDNPNEAFMSTGLDVSINTTEIYYKSIVGNDGFKDNDTINHGQQIFPLNATVTKIGMIVSAGVGANKDYWLNLYKNGQPTNASLKFNSTDSLGKMVNLTNPVSVKEGDELIWALKINGSGTTAIRGTAMIFVYEPITNGESSISGNTDDLLPASATSEYIQWVGVGNTYNSLSEEQVKELSNDNFTLKRLYVEFVNDSTLPDLNSTVNWTFTSRINGADGNVSCTIRVGQSSCTNLTAIDNIRAGDFVDLEVTSDGSDAVPPYAKWAIVQDTSTPTTNCWTYNLITRILYIPGGCTYYKTGTGFGYY